MSVWLDIIGCGEGDLPRVPAVDTIVAPKRIIERLRASGVDEGRLSEWRSLKLDDMIAQITALRGTRTALLASGDPLWFGIGATLRRHLSPGEFRVEPHASSFQYAAARMRWPLQNVLTLSAHARPPEVIHPHILPGSRILALTTDATTAPHVANMLVERGYGSSILTVLENLGGPHEHITSAPADTFSLAIGDFYVLAIDCVADAGAPLLPPIPGLPDDAFISDGQLTKREVRAATLAKLAPYPGALLWDVGAGCGSIAIEWMRAARDARAVTFEREGERLQMIAVNAAKLGVPGLDIAPGDAPATFADQPTPDAVFLGGDVANDALFAAAWDALRPGGRFVANAVTIEGEAALYARHATFGGDLARIEVGVLDTVGRHRVLRPRMAVTQWLAVKR